MLQRILSGWYELAEPLTDLEQYLAEHTGYVVQVRPNNLARSARRIAKYLAEDHAQPAAAISHLHDWLTWTMGHQLRGAWVGFLAQAQGAPGLRASQRADLVVIAEVLQFSTQSPQRLSRGDLFDLAAQALTSGSPDRLLLELGRVEPQLAQLARKEVERSRSPLSYGRSPRRWTVLTAGAVLLAAAGVVTAALPDDPPPLPGRAVVWSKTEFGPTDPSWAEVDVPADATRLVLHPALTDPDPGQGACPGLLIALQAEPGGHTAWQPLDRPLSVAVPAGQSKLRITLSLNGESACRRHIDTQRVDFER
ncbi:hypothetical protein ACFV1L_27285 [Kitasatospora sp. NPDC059646]|uniref:hypothetical protein n=1 Tax=Kitasatospora sp. NPDC059646 TaxID=3346893 RepID=UPI0036976E6B